MNQDKLPISEVATQLTQTPYSFRLSPLTPDEWEVNQAIADALLEQVFGSKIVSRKSEARWLYYTVDKLDSERVAMGALHKIWNNICTIINYCLPLRLH